jgi:hypothetical protein
MNSHPEGEEYIDASHEMMTVGEINGFRHAVMKNNFM